MSWVSPTRIAGSPGKDGVLESKLARKSNHNWMRPLRDTAAAAAAEAGVISKENRGLRKEVSSLRRNYDRTADKASSLREALRAARLCLERRDKQLAVADRTIDRLTIEHEKLEAAVADDRRTIAKLEGQLSTTCAPGQLRTRLAEERRCAAALAEAAATAEAKARAADAVLDKYEREVLLLRAALEVRAAELSVGGGEPVRVQLLTALAQARDGEAEAVAQLAAAQRRATGAESEVRRLALDAAELRQQLEAAQASVLKLQASLIDASDVAEQLRSQKLEAHARSKQLTERLQALGARHSDAAAVAEGLREHCARLEGALRSAEGAATAQLQRVQLQWEGRLRDRGREAGEAQRALREQLDAARGGLEDAAGELAAVRAELEREREEGVRAREGLVAELEATRRAELERQRGEGERADEVTMLHDQVNDLTDMNGQLQTELDDAQATVLLLKEEKGALAERAALLEVEVSHVVGESGTSTSVLQRQCAALSEEAAALRADNAALRAQLQDTRREAQRAASARAQSEHDAVALRQHAERLTESKELLQRSLTDQVAAMRAQISQLQAHNTHLISTCDSSARQHEGMLLLQRADAPSPAWIRPHTAQPVRAATPQFTPHPTPARSTAQPQRLLGQTGSPPRPVDAAATPWSPTARPQATFGGSHLALSPRSPSYGGIAAPSHSEACHICARVSSSPSLHDCSAPGVPERRPPSSESPAQDGRRRAQRTAPTNLARWEQRLRAAEERLQLMRTELRRPATVTPAAGSPAHPAEPAQSLRWSTPQPVRDMDACAAAGASADVFSPQASGPPSRRHSHAGDAAPEVRSALSHSAHGAPPHDIDFSTMHRNPDAPSTLAVASGSELHESAWMRHSPTAAAEDSGPTAAADGRPLRKPAGGNHPPGLPQPHRSPSFSGDMAACSPHSYSNPVYDSESALPSGCTHAPRNSVQGEQPHPDVSPMAASDSPPTAGVSTPGMHLDASTAGPRTIRPVRVAGDSSAHEGVPARTLHQDLSPRSHSHAAAVAHRVGLPLRTLPPADASRLVSPGFARSSSPAMATARDILQAPDAGTPLPRAHSRIPSAPRSSGRAATGTAAASITGSAAATPAVDPNRGEAVWQAGAERRSSGPGLADLAMMDPAELEHFLDKAD